MKVLSARLSDKLYADLEAVAAERRRNRGEVVREAIEMYLAAWADYHVAMDRLHDPTDLLMSEQEFLDELGWDV